MAMPCFGQAGVNKLTVELRKNRFRVYDNAIIVEDKISKCAYDTAPLAVLSYTEDFCVFECNRCVF